MTKQSSVTPLAFSTEPLKAAIVEYDNTQAARNQLWDAAESNEDVAAAEAADQVALSKVQDAFYEATKDRNRREDCRRVDMAFMRQIAARY